VSALGVRRTLGLSLTAFATGCYTFAPVTPASVPVGGQVRVGLTAAGAAALAPTLGTGITGVEGAVVRQAGDTLVVRPTTLEAAGGVDVVWTGSDVAIPAGWTTGVERRRVSTVRTALLVGGGVAAAAAVIGLARSGGSDKGSSGTDQPPNLSRNPR